MQRAATEVRVEHRGVASEERGVLEGDGNAVRQADPLDPDHLVTGDQVEVPHLFGPGSVQPAATAPGELACMPRRAISSVKDRNTPARRWTGRLATNVPWPRRRSTRPALLSSCSAWRTVIRLTVKRAQSSASVGRGSPGVARSMRSRR